MINYTGTFKVIREVVDWINNFVPSSDVEVTPILDHGTKIATITVDEVPTDIYAPTGGGGSTFFEQQEYTNINGDTVNVLCQLPEAIGSDPYFATAEYTNINGDTVTVLYQV